LQGAEAALQFIKKAVGLRKVVLAILVFLHSHGLGCHPAIPCKKTPKLLGPTFASPSRLVPIRKYLQI